MILQGRPSPLYRRLVALSALVLAAAVLTRRAELLPLAAPALWALVVPPRSGGGPPTSRVKLSVAADVEPAHCFEGEPVQLRLAVRSSAVLDELALTLALPPGWSPAPGQSRRAAGEGTDRVELELTVLPARWGRWPAGELRAAARWSGRRRAATGVARLAPEVVVFPRPALVRPGAPARTRGYGVGDTASRQPDVGLEFAEVRAYSPTDPARRINWPVSTRRGALHVTTYAAERPVDLVLLLDAFSDVGPPGATSLDLAVRGAVGFAQAHLRRRDRVGLVVLGGRLRWLAPGIGRRQFYRILAAAVDLGRDASFLAPTLARLPRAALPPTALVIAFTPLLDERCLLVLRDVRERGLPVVVVDVLRGEPPEPAFGRLGTAALRLWRLEREATRYALADLGIGLLSWDGTGPLQLPRQVASAAGQRAGVPR